MAKPDIVPAFYRAEEALDLPAGNPRRRALFMVALATLLAASAGAAVFLFVLYQQLRTVGSSGHDGWRHWPVGPGITRT